MAQTVFLYNARLLVRAICRARVEGAEHVPFGGGLIIACNHSSMADPTVLQAYIPRHITYLMGSKYYDVPIVNQFVRFYGALCIEENGLNKRTLRHAEELLHRGRAVGIFPEGGISRDGEVHPAQPGVALLAHRTSLPILPVGMSGVERILPPDTFRFRPARVGISIGEAIEPTGLARRDITPRVEEAIRNAVDRARELLW
jgi:1-acyl-sn-glycerol-3-phosphate acyltransferase